MQGSVSNVVHGVDVRASHQEQIDALDVLLIGSIVQWAEAFEFEEEKARAKRENAE